MRDGGACLLQILLNSIHDCPKERSGCLCRGVGNGSGVSHRTTPASLEPKKTTSPTPPPLAPAAFVKFTPTRVRQWAHVSEAAATSGAQSTEAATQLNSLTATAADKKHRRAGYAVLYLGYAMLCACVCAVRAYVCQCVERSVLF